MSEQEADCENWSDESETSLITFIGPEINKVALTTEKEIRTQTDTIKSLTKSIINNNIE